MNKCFMILWSFFLLSIDTTFADEPYIIYVTEESPPLMWAVYKNDKDGVQRLINEGVDINATDNRDKTSRYNNTALCLAAALSRLEIATLLADAGVDLDKICYSGKPALHEVVLHGDIAMTKMLLEKGANTEIKDVWGHTALYMFGYQHNKLELLELMLEKGADVNAEDQEGNTVLHHIASGFNSNAGYKKLGAIKLLIKYGADPNVVNKDGRKALDYTRENLDLCIQDRYSREQVPYLQAVVDYLSPLTK